MSEQGFWNSDWADVQRKYWESWSDLSRKAMGMDAPPKSPWEQGLDHWWQAVAPAAPEMARDFMTKMMEQGKSFFHVAEEFGRKFQAQGGSDDWTDVMNRTFADMREAFTGAQDFGKEDALHKMMAFWELPLDNWQRMVSSLSLMPGDTLRNMPHGDAAGHFERLISAPGLGYTREEQRQQKEMIRRVVDYQRALQEYMAFFSNIGVLSVDRMRKIVEGLANEGKSIDSARVLYDTWVGACEEVYGEQVMTPEYAKIHGQLVNALMGVKYQMGCMVDESLGALNMPTRAELRTLQSRMQENRREIKRLRAEMASLQEQLAGPRTSPRPAAKRKTAVRKKAVVKKAAPPGK